MSLARKFSLAMSMLALFAAVAAASPPPFKQERVPGGALELFWAPGFGVGRVFTPLTLPAGDPAIPNPSGDNTVAVLQNNDINLGGIAESCTDTGGQFDFAWEADVFMGAGNTRRGLVLRADSRNGFQSFYQFVINPGLFLVRFRKFVDGAPLPADLASWQGNLLPGGIPQVNTWHHMTVWALGNRFQCFWDGTELTAGSLGSPIVDNDSPLLAGWVGAYNFSASVGEVPAYFDNLVLSHPGITPVASKSWGQLKRLYR